MARVLAFDGLRSGVGHGLWFGEGHGLGSEVRMT